MEIKADSFHALNGLLFILSDCFFNAKLSGFGDNAYHPKAKIKAF